LGEPTLPELLAALRAADGIDLVREVAQWALQELLRRPELAPRPAR